MSNVKQHCTANCTKLFLAGRKDGYMGFAPKIVGKKQSKEAILI